MSRRMRVTSGSSRVSSSSITGVGGGSPAPEMKTRSWSRWTAACGRKRCGQTPLAWGITFLNPINDDISAPVPGLLMQ